MEITVMFPHITLPFGKLLLHTYNCRYYTSVVFTLRLDTPLLVISSVVVRNK